MGKAPYQHRYERDHPGNQAKAATDQGAAPDPADLGWCIRRAWRVIYYSYRQATGQSLWEGVDEFEILMADVLFRLSSGFEPIAPIRRPEEPKKEPQPFDSRDERIYQPSCRVYPTPNFKRRQRLD